MEPVSSLRRKSLTLLEDFAHYHLVTQTKLLIKELKRFNPAQPRVPAGNSDGGQWTDGGGSNGGSNIADDFEDYLSESAGALSEGIRNLPSAVGNLGRTIYNNPAEGLDDLFGPGGYLGWLPAAGTYGRLSTIEAEAARRTGRGILRGEAGLTGHGAKRVLERTITNAEAQEAIITAQKAKNVTNKIGKYKTLQHVYKGSNGVTVIVETAGRNAGKIITLYRHK